jgi:RHS repeat-associated protein
MFDSYGNILSESNVANGDRFKFTAREWDIEIGQYSYRARNYGPTIGRFISEDPLGFGGGDSNLYRYVGNMPNLLTDPTGEIFPLIVAGGVIGGLLLFPPAVNTTKPGMYGRSTVGAAMGMAAATGVRFLGPRAVLGGKIALKQGTKLSKKAVTFLWNGLKKKMSKALKKLAGGKEGFKGEGNVTLREDQYVIGVVKDGKVIKVENQITSHANIASRAGVLDKSGKLTKGSAVFTLFKKGGRLIPLGSINFGGIANVSEATIKAIIQYFK